MSTIEHQLPDQESAQVFDWRFAELMRAGYTPDEAWQLAVEPGVDIRLAERLLAEGCPRETAQRILL